MFGPGGCHAPAWSATRRHGSPATAARPHLTKQAVVADARPWAVETVRAAWDVATGPLAEDPGTGKAPAKALRSDAEPGVFFMSHASSKLHASPADPGYMQRGWKPHGVSVSAAENVLQSRHFQTDCLILWTRWRGADGRHAGHGRRPAQATHAGSAIRCARRRMRADRSRRAGNNAARSRLAGLPLACRNPLARRGPATRCGFSLPLPRRPGDDTSGDTPGAGGPPRRQARLCRVAPDAELAHFFVDVGP